MNKHRGKWYVPKLVPKWLEDEKQTITSMCIEIMGKPVGLVSNTELVLDTKHYDRVVMAMGFKDSEDYMKEYPGNFKLGSPIVKKISEYDCSSYNNLKLEIFSEKRFPKDFFACNYFWCTALPANRWGKTALIFSAAYDKILKDDEPLGCMFLVQPTIEEAKHSNEFKSNEICNRWFCSDWKED